MLLLRKPIALITYEDVEDFLNLGLPEGTQLDYKENLPEQPRKLAQTLAAFANTMGGLILFGVKEGTDKQPVVPSPGMPLRRGMVEQVQRTAVDHLWPVLVPEVGLVRIPGDEERCFLVVRVPQSLQAPHAIANGREIYIRRGDSNHPEVLAELRWIEHLLERRSVTEQQRHALLNRSIKRFKTVAGSLLRDYGTPWGYAYVCPAFPVGPLGTEHDLHDSFQEKFVRFQGASMDAIQKDRRRSTRGWRHSDRVQPEVVQLQRAAGGTTRSEALRNVHDLWLDASVEGHLMMARPFEQIDLQGSLRNQNRAEFGILSWDVVTLFTRTLLWSHQLLSQWGWQGHVVLGLTLKQVEGSRLTWFRNDSYDYDPDEWDGPHQDDSGASNVRVIDGKVSVEETVLSSEMEEPEELVGQMLQRISWGMGMPPLSYDAALDAAAKVVKQLQAKST